MFGWPKHVLRKPAKSTTYQVLTFSSWGKFLIISWYILGSGVMHNLVLQVTKNHDIQSNVNQRFYNITFCRHMEKLSGVILLKLQDIGFIEHIHYTFLSIQCIFLDVLWNGWINFHNCPRNSFKICSTEIHECFQNSSQTFFPLHNPISKIQENWNWDCGKQVFCPLWRILFKYL